MIEVEYDTEVAYCSFGCAMMDGTTKLNAEAPEGEPTERDLTARDD